MKIAIFNGGTALINPNSNHLVKINGQEPEQVVEATDANITEFLGNPQEIKDNLEQGVK